MALELERGDPGRPDTHAAGTADRRIGACPQATGPVGSRLTRRATLHANRHRSLREGPQPRAPRAAAGRARARPDALLPGARGTRRARGRRWRGAERIMLGSNNYLGLTGDERVKDAARAALERYGTGLTGSRFLNGTLDLHLELERELADWMGSEDALVYTTGYLANTGAIGTLLDPGDTVICDTRRPRLDPRRGVALARPRPPLPPQPARQARVDAVARRVRRRRRARGGGRRLLDGGRPRPAARRGRALPRARRAADGRRGPRRGRARRPRRRRLRAVRLRGRGRPADGDLLQVARLVRRLHRRARTT